MTKKSKEAEVVYLPSIQKAIETVRVMSDAKIAKMSKDYMKLKTNGVDDKEAYNTVREARIDVKNQRVLMEHKRKELVEGANQYLKVINGEARRIKEKLEPIEKYLQEEESKVAEEKKRLKEEKIRKQQEELQAKILKVHNAGLVFDGRTYFMSAEGTEMEDLSLLPDVLAKADDVLIETYVSKAAEIKEARKAANAEADAKKAAEKAAKEKEDKERADELERLRKENEELRAKASDKEPAVESKNESKLETVFTIDTTQIEAEHNLLKDMCADVANVRPREFKVIAFQKIQEKVFENLRDIIKMVEIEAVVVLNKAEKDGKE